MKEKIKTIIKEDIEVKNLLLNDKAIESLIGIKDELISTYKNKGKIIVFGNGGSAADAQHMVCELVGRFKKERRPLPAISLTVNTSSLTAIANDYSYDASFSRQLEALSFSQDAVIAISTSGNAVNVIEAVKKAKELGLRTIALTGKDGGALAKLADISFIVPSNNTPRVQEAHILIIHILCELIEDAICNET